MSGEDVKDKKVELINALEEVNAIEDQAKTKKLWLIGTFSGLFVVIAGVLVILAAHGRVIAPYHTTTGFRLGVVGFLIYWGFRAVHIVKSKMAQSKKGYQRKHIDKGE